VSTTGFLEPFAELGQKLEEDFRRAQYSEAAFADLAAAHVERARLHENFNLAELARWALAARDIPPQEDIEAEFGDPPVTLWNGRRFFVSAIVWASSSTAIHRHAFTGAFQVLHGSSVHARYDFATEHVVSEDMAVGRLKSTAIETLTKGAVRQIPEGDRGIHSLFHLEHPSVSLVVRTHADNRFPIQLRYYPPGLAIWDQRREPAQVRSRQFAKAMLGLGAAEAEAAFSAVLPGMPACDAFWVLEEARRGASLALALKLLERCRSALHPTVAKAFDDALTEVDRRAAIRNKREHVRDPALRYFLAILLNAQKRSDVLTLAAAYAPERNAIESVLAWLAELANVTLLLQAGGAPWEPSIFGLPEMDSLSRDSLRSTLAGSPVLPAGPAPFHEAVYRGQAFAALFRT